MHHGGHADSSVAPGVSIVVVGNSALEAVALRAVLEVFNYRVDMHWIGARHQLFEVMAGVMPTSEHVVMCCHGTVAGIVMETGEPAVGAGDLRGNVKLPGRVVVSTGCGTGAPEFASVFLEAGCEAYVAPSDEVESGAAMLFLAHLFYLLREGCTIRLAIKHIGSAAPETTPFHLYDLHQDLGEVRTADA